MNRQPSSCARTTVASARTSDTASNMPPSGAVPRPRRVTARAVRPSGMRSVGSIPQIDCRLMGLRVALVGGPMYDGLYAMLPSDVEIVVQADHPTLNRRVDELLGAGMRIDVLSTHSKYAPSQRQWLRPLDDLVPEDVVDELAPRAVDLCRFDKALLSVPRNIDVRVLWYRSDVMEAPPDTWAALLASPFPFGFPGRESGLFGTFFEIVQAHGGKLFDDDARPTMVSSEAVEAVEMLCALAAKGPDDLPDWHYDQVDARSEEHTS